MAGQGKAASEGTPSLAAALEGIASAGDLEAAQRRLVGLQRDLTGARLAVWLEPEEGGVRARFVDPEGAAPAWLERARQRVPAALASGEAHFEPLDPAAELGEGATLAVQPLRNPDGGGAAVALEIETPSRFVLALTHERLALSAAAATSATLHSGGAEELLAAVAVAAATNAQSRGDAAARAFCDQLHTGLEASRVSLALVQGGRARIVAISRTREFDAELEGVSALEAAARELVGSEGILADPAHPPTSSVLRQFGERSGSGALLGLALTPDDPDGCVVLAEREAHRPFSARDLERMRLAAELCGAPLLRTLREDAPLLARLRHRFGGALGRLGEPRHTGRKLVAVLGALALLVLVFGRGDFEVEAPVVIEAVERRVLTAPFDGELAQADLEPGAPVVADETLIAALDTRELSLELSRSRAEARRHRTEADIARSTGDPARAEVARLAARRSDARVALLESRIDEARLLAPVSGVLIAGDLKRRLGGAVVRGEVLAEVAPLDELRGDVFVAEVDVHEVAVGQRGRLRTAASPGREIPFEVLRIDPAAEVREGSNRFRVRVRLEPEGELPLPGSQGVARIEVGRASWLWILSRRLIGTVRLWLWI